MMSHNTEADILAATYGDACTVYRPVKRMLPNLETVIQDGLDGEIVMSGIPCALSSPSGGKLQHGEATSDVKTDYLLFVRPEVDIRPGDTVLVTRLGRTYRTVAGKPERQPSHNNIPLTLVEDTV